MLSKIHLDKQTYEHYITETNPNCLSNLNRINIFIGKNNTGKSRFLRTLFADKKFNFEVSEINFPKLKEVLKNVLTEISSNFTHRNIGDVSSKSIRGVKENLSSIIAKLESFNFSNVSDLILEINKFWQNMSDFKVDGGSGLPGRTQVDISPGTSIVEEAVDKNNSLLKELLPKEFNYSPERIYIPILRGLRPTQCAGGTDDTKFVESKDNYLQRTIRDYFQKEEIDTKTIFTGLRLYDDIKKMLLSGQEERRKLKGFEEFLSTVFFNSQSVSLIPNIEDDSVHVSMGREERPIYMVGDGIQSIIILLYPLFLNQGKKLLVFIEEPENSMHPGMQRLFVETLMRNEFKSFQYFITTHSNHFLDITIDIDQMSLYTFAKVENDNSKEHNYYIRNILNQDNRILDLIGVRNASVFLSNCTIWVEGITDRFYIKKYLEVYQNYLIKTNNIKVVFREDFNFSFIEYSGGNIVHWSFGDETIEDESVWNKIDALKINSKIFLLADKDNTESKPNSEKAKRLKLLKKQLVNNFKITKAIEIENTLSPKIIINTIRKLENGNSSKLEYDPSEIVYSKYKDKKLGKFIEEKFKNCKRKYKDKSGTIFPKLDFCKAAIGLISEYDDLTEEGKEIAKEIFNFIKRNNSEAIEKV